MARKPSFPPAAAKGAKARPMPVGKRSAVPPPMPAPAAPPPPAAPAAGAGSPLGFKKGGKFEGSARDKREDAKGKKGKR